MRHARASLLPVRTARAPEGPRIHLITSELVTNAYKHPFQRRGSGNIVVKFLTDGPKQLVLSVGDTGDGFAPSFAKGAGCEIVEGLARTLDGSVSYGGGPGTEVIVRIARDRGAGHRGLSVT